MGVFKHRVLLCVASTFVGCRIALVSAGWTISHLVRTNGCRNHSSSLVGASFLYCRQFSVRRRVAGRTALTIESLLIVGVVKVVNPQRMAQRSFGSSVKVARPSLGGG